MKLKLLVILILITITFSLFGFEEGYASWYGGKFQGRLTANGEIFDTYKLTAAHKTLPFDTIVKVTNLSNNLSVLVRINDRGPFITGRIIDLSNAGIAKVRITISNESGSETGIESTVKHVIQVASYSARANADRTRNLLTSNGLSPEYEVTANGLTRILLRDISNDELSETLNTLKMLGFSRVLIRKN